MKRLSILFAAALLPAAWVPAAEDELRPLHSDPVAGYSLRIPGGYEKLTEDENREVFEGLSQFLGKDVGERVLKRPPAWFKGPINPAKPKAPPPSLAIGCSEMDQAIDPALMPQYKANFEENFKKKGDRYGELRTEIVQVDGINALRMEHDIFSPIDNSRSRMINIAVPGRGRLYDIVFNFSTHEAEGVEQAVATVLRTFKVDQHPVSETDGKGKWTRVMMWTVGGLVAGILLSLLLKVLAGAGAKTAEESGG